MYKVLLVDDEPIARTGMKKVIDWEKLGFYICGEADSGESACECLEKYQPDLVITDVMMPLMNGIELAEYINQRFPGTEVIIISGYDEFDFARSAMRAGVMEYIMKPTEKSELEKALLKVFDRIRKKSEFEKNLREMREEAEKNLPILKKQFYNDLANRMLSEEKDIGRSLAYYGSPLHGKTFRLWCFRLDRDEEYDDIPEMRELLWEQLEILIRDKFNENCCYDSFMRGRLCCYIAQEKEPKGDWQNLMEELLEEVLSEFKKLTRNSVSVGISREYDDYYHLYRARKDCEAALEFQYHLGEGSCIFYSEVQNFASESMEYNYELLNKICMKLRAFNKKDGKILIEKLYMELKENKAIYQQVYSQTVMILTELYGISSNEETREKLRRLFSELHQYKTADMLSALVLNLVDEMVDTASAGVGEKNKEILQQVIKYVDDHLGEKISLADVADAVHLSKNYLCSIFKKEQGETFFAYLMRVRIEKAKKLLRTTDHKVYVIAEMVGYTDYYYFSQVFKKIVGITAGEYREIYDGE